MKALYIRSRLGVVLIACCLGLAASLGCTWGWQQDNCANVLCPSGCYQFGFGTTQAICNAAAGPGDECCTCWYRERKCNFNDTSTRCYRAVPPAPNSYAWEVSREVAVGDCEDSQWGHVCTTSMEDPWAPL